MKGTMQISRLKSKAAYYYEKSFDERYGGDFYIFIEPLRGILFSIINIIFINDLPRRITCFSIMGTLLYSIYLYQYSFCSI